MENNQEKFHLNNRDRLEIVIEAGINAIPYIGGSLSTLYFGRNNEIRLKRIEAFYNLIRDNISEIEDKISSVDHVDKDALLGIIEEINANVEKDYLNEKAEFFKNSFYNSLLNQKFDTYDKRKHFIQVLSNLTKTDIKILKELHLAEPGSGYQPTLENIRPGDNEFIGSLEKLASHGFLNKKITGTLKPGIDLISISRYELSEYGQEFIDYCLILNK